MANLDRVRSHWTSEPVPKHDHVFGHPYGNRHVDFFNDYNDENAPFTVYGIEISWKKHTLEGRNSLDTGTWSSKNVTAGRVAVGSSWVCRRLNYVRRGHCQLDNYLLHSDVPPRGEYAW